MQARTSSTIKAKTMSESKQPVIRPTRRESTKALHAGHEHEHSRWTATSVQQDIGPYLLVSRETGAGGSEIARHVAQGLGWEILDNDILDILASEYGTPAVVLDVVDEKKPSWLTDLLNGWVEGHGFSQLTYLQRLHRLFNAAAQRGNVVIVGRGARFILPRQAGLSVRIIAPLAFRVEQTILRQGLSARQAHEFVEQSDRQRNAFIKKYFHQSIADPHAHDLVVNVENLIQNDAVELVINAVTAWLKSSGIGASRSRLVTS
jgi:cytidylate kinase